MKAFVDMEIQDVQFDANDLLEEWGEQIWPQAFHFYQVIEFLSIIYLKKKMMFIFLNHNVFRLITVEF